MPKRTPYYLHDAMKIILKETQSRSATTNYLSEEINKRGLYIQRLGGPVFPDQIFLRARKYPTLFELKGREIVILKETV